MEKMGNKTDKYFRDRLMNFEQSPPDAAWDAIMTKLESRKKKRAMLIFLRIAAGMALLLSAGIGLYFVGTRDESPVDITGRVAEQFNENTSNRGETRDAIPESPVVGNSNEINIQTVRQSDKETEKQPVEYNNEPLVEYDNRQVEQSTDFPEIEIARQENLPVPENSIVNIIAIAQADTSMTPEQAAAALLAMNDATEDEPVKPRRWTIGSELAPLYSNRSIRSQGLNNNEVNSLNSSETGILAYAGGIRVAVNAGKRLTVQSGVYYSRYGQQINDVRAFADDRVSDNHRFIAATTSTGSIEGIISARSQAFLNNGSYNELDNAAMYYGSDGIKEGITTSSLKPLVDGDVQSIQLRQYFDYFELPLILRYKVIDRKMDFSFSGGLITNFMVGNTVNLIADGDSKSIGETSEINQINYLGSFGLGVEMPLSGNFSLSFEPRFRYYINSIDRSGYISVHPYSFGFFAGVNYRF